MSTDAQHIVCAACGGINRVPSAKLGAGPKCGKCQQPLLDGQVINATQANFSRHLGRNDLPVVVDFWAPWCGPCLQFAPTYSQVAAELATRARFVKLDTEAQPQAAAPFQIRSIPTLMVFYQGKEVARLSGALPKRQFLQWLNQQLALLPG